MTGESAPDPRQAVVAETIRAHHWHSDSHGLAGWCECKHRNVDHANEWRVHVAAAVLVALDATATGPRPTAPLAPERPRDINLVESRLRTRLHAHPEQSVVLTAEEARTLMRSISNAGRRLCSD